MALAHRKRTTTIILDSDMDGLLADAARQLGISRSEFIRRQLARVLEQYRDHPSPRSAGVIAGPVAERGEEDELFGDLER